MPPTQLYDAYIQLDATNGKGSNREVFLTHATLDSNQRGLAVFDNSYVSMVGCWAASSDLDNIWTHPSSNPQLVISGGTVFNGGSEGGDCAHDQCNGCGACADVTAAASPAVKCLEL